jgi:PAS domain S-box-containing protein
MAQRFPKGLQQQLVLAFTLVLLIPMATIAVYSQARSRTTLIHEAADQHQHTAVANAHEAEQVLARAANDLLFIANAPSVRGFASGAQVRPGELRQLFRTFLGQRASGYLGLCLFDSSGATIACERSPKAAPPGVNAAAIERSLIDQALLPQLDIGRSAAPTLAVDPAAPGAPLIRYAIRLLDQGGTARGVVMLEVSAAPIFDILLLNDPLISATILDTSGNYLLPSAGVDAPDDTSLILEQRNGAIIDSRERPGVLQVFHEIDFPSHGELRWIVVYSESMREILGSVGQTLGVMALIMLGALIAALLVAQVIAGGIVRPLRELSLAAARVGSGDLHTPLPHNGPDEIAALSRTFDFTLARLRASIELAEGRQNEAETLRAAASALGSTLSLSPVLDLILSELRKVVPYDSASVQEVRDNSSTIIGAYGLAHGEALVGASFSLTPGTTPNAEVARTRATLLLDDAPAHYRHFRSAPFWSDPIHSWMGVPLLFGDRLIGMITLDKHEPNFYTAAHVRLAGDFAAHAAVAIENARLYEAAQHELAERGRAEAAAGRFQALIEATTDFVAMCEPLGRIIYINRAGRALLGLSDDDVTGTHAFDFATPTAREELQTAGLLVMESGSWSGETTLLARDGSEIPVSVVIIAHRGVDGEVEYFSTIMRDLRERRRAEDELRQAQKMEALGRLAGGLAHDFNNLLTVILGECDLLLEELRGDEPNLAAASQIRQSGQRAAALTRQLLAFSRRQVLQPELIELNAVILGMEQLLRRLIGEDVNLTLTLAADTPVVRADPGQIEQVVMNLAINARDAMPDGGHLLIETVAMELDGESSRQCAGVSPGRYAALVVSDTGLGMDEATQAHVFEPFFTTKPRGKGTGLGLATVHGIVRQSGGEIWFSSEQGRGSSFRVLLPAAPGEPADSEPQPRSIPALPAAETVLLVEDDENVRKLARTILVRYGFSVLEAGDGPAAVALARSHPGAIHALLTDVVMPGGLNGVQTATAVRALRPQIRVLYMSGYTDDVLAERDLLAEDTRYIQKPFTPNGLVSALLHALTT